ncbi:MAG TPA: hypothetical protein PKA00_13905 [Saprospiraceae bacterium]|nr:hypothetical protein [Saprospiraceae bacterium]
MTKLEEVLEIVKSLSKTERRYVSIAANRLEDDREKKKSYLFILERLFFICDKSNTDEKLLQELLDEEKKGDNAAYYITVNINQLKDFLLSQLRSYYSEKPDYKAYNHLQNIRLLLQRRLYKQALSMTLEVKAELKKNGNSALVLFEVINLERYCMQYIDKGFEINNLNQVNSESLETLKQIQIVNGARNDAAKVQKYYVKGDFQISLNELNYSNEVLKVIENLNHADHLSIEAACLILPVVTTHFAYFDINENKALDASKKLVDKFESDQTYIVNDPDSYFKALIKYLNRLILQNKMELFLESFEKVKAILHQSNKNLFPYLADDERDKYKISPNVELTFELLNQAVMLANLQGQPEELKLTLEEAKKALDRKPLITGQKYLIILFNIATGYLLLNEHTEVEHYYKTINDFQDSKSLYILNRLDLLVIFNRLEQCRTNADLERVETLIGEMITKIKNIKPEEEKELFRRILSRLNLLLFEKDTARQKKILEEELQAVRLEELNKHQLQIFKLWAQKKLKQL